MSNYTVTTNFGAKDGLTSGNPAKLILGAQLTTEYNNIATAIATKVDSGGALSGTTITASGLITGTAGATISGGTTTTAAITASGLVTANAGLTVAGAAFTSRGILDNATANALTIGSDGGLTIGSPTGGDQGAATLNTPGLFINGVAAVAAVTGSFTATLTGMTTATTGTVNYAVYGKVVTLWCNATISGTSNTTAMTMTGLPAAIQTASTVNGMTFQVLNNGQNSGALASPSGNTITFSTITVSGANLVLNSFTSSGVKGLSLGFTLTYPL